jgi:hypothetical protein
MFTRFAKSALARFWPVQRGCIARVAHAVGPGRSYCNDNLPGFRRPAVAGKHRAAPPALACHWLLRDGRLECCWHVVTGDERTRGRDAEHPLPRRLSGALRCAAVA